MNNGTNNFQNFIGISSLQKTLRNALIPTETTQQFIVKNGIIKEDEDISSAEKQLALFLK